MTKCEEKAIQRKIVKWINSLEKGYAVVYQATDIRGIPDILACVDGRFFAFEVKRHDGIVSTIQKAQMRKINRAGGIALPVKTLEDVQLTIELAFQKGQKG
jgi:Holliday junction resolvase